MQKQMQTQNQNEIQDQDRATSQSLLDPAVNTARFVNGSPAQRRVDEPNARAQAFQRNTGMARGLGYFSLALGLSELLAPNLTSKVAGTHRSPRLFRAFGAREILAGVGLLTMPAQRSFWIWSRVAGDAMDLSALGWAAAKKPPRVGLTVAAIAAVAGVTALDVYCALRERPALG